MSKGRLHTISQKQWLTATMLNQVRTMAGRKGNGMCKRYRVQDCTPLCHAPDCAIALNGRHECSCGKGKEAI
jgi:hypothetical protein